MSCSRYQELLLEQFGQRQLDSELQRHLAACPACRTFWNELAGLSGNLGSDDLFSPDEMQVEQLVMQVSQTINRGMQYKYARDHFSFVKNVWVRYIPVAAAAALVLGIAVGGYMAGKTAFGPEKSELVLSQTAATDLLSDGNEELDENAVGTLIYDFATGHTYEAGEWLLDDLTEEELKYLEESFNVGDLL